QIISLGKAATKYVKTLVKPGDEINLELDVQTRDRYGRLLVYVYIKDGRMLNELIVKDGYASPLTYPPNVKYVELFQRAFEKAREENKGLWE
ncbi:MAG: thermonuclease family protein, partial [Bacteroidota bacterium]